MIIVDRIVALMESDSPIDDDTILRILAFHKHQLGSIYLPEIFRQAGRTTEQYFHAVECLLSLRVDYLHQVPLNYLISTRRNALQPTFDEWDEVDLETIRRIVPTSLEEAHKM
ncbi:hypothetical protein BLNAU_10299 [Blattamonas nauphoetae]|uniref:Uncharacterized protein n=1 Tax=Blattamonas nauphoetae TaxID=2049346 RepID=A0ABQ9XTL5_9EUKA|nr:hypothetical protein BLNAU_10299 [Blattamonas nauphoetae]